MITKFLGEKQWPLKQALERRLVAMTLLPEEGEAEIREVAEWGRRPSCDWSTAARGRSGGRPREGRANSFSLLLLFPKRKAVQVGTHDGRTGKDTFSRSGLGTEEVQLCFQPPQVPLSVGALPGRFRGPSWEVRTPCSACVFDEGLAFAGCDF